MFWERVVVMNLLVRKKVGPLLSKLHGVGHVAETMETSGTFTICGVHPRASCGGLNPTKMGVRVAEFLRSIFHARPRYPFRNMPPMTIELREALAGVDDSVAAKLAEQDIVSLEDAADLTAADLDSLGFTIGVRNKILKAVMPTTARRVASLTGSVKNLLSSVTGGLGGAGSGTPSELATLLSVLKPFESKVDTRSIESRRKLWRAWDTNGNDLLSLAEADQGVKVLLINELKSDKANGERIWRRFRKSYIRAFLDAADAAPQRKTRGATVALPSGKRRAVCDDDYVTQREFRLLICYLSIYAIMYELFTLIDGGGAWTCLPAAIPRCCSCCYPALLPLLPLTTRGLLFTGEGVTAADDARISRAEWVAAIPAIQDAAASWAPFEVLKGIKADGSDFETIDANGGGFVLLTELCEWIEQGEKAAKTATGELLGVGE